MGADPMRRDRKLSNATKETLLLKTLLALLIVATSMVLPSIVEASDRCTWRV